MKKLEINPNNKRYYSDEYVKGWEDGAKAQYETTIDAVEVVRCKDCKWYGTTDCQIQESFYGIKDFDFCSYGERKGGDDE